MYKKRPVFICSNCGKPIYEGDRYLDYLGEQLCRRCIEKNTSTAVNVDEID